MIRSRDSDSPTVPNSYQKEIHWVCENCDFNEEEIKTVCEPTDQMRFKSIASMAEKKGVCACYSSKKALNYP